MKIFLKFTYVLLSIIAISVVGCSSDDNNGSPDNGGSTGTNSGVSMKINGENWNASLNYLLTETNDEGTAHQYRQVYISGTRFVEANNASADEVSETLSLYIKISEDKFTNPKGIYPVYQEGVGLGESWAVFSTATNMQTASFYLSGNPNNPGEPVGSIEITGFKIGQETIFGQPTGVEGYTELSGKFNLELFSLHEEDSSLQISEGKFNLKSNISVGFD